MYGNIAQLDLSMQSEKTLLPNEDPLVSAEFVPNQTLLQAAFAQTIYKALPSTSIVLFFLFLVLAFAHAVFLPPSAALVMIPIAGLSTFYFLATFWLTKGEVYPESWAHSIAGSFGIVGMLNSLAHLAVTQDPIQSSNLILLIAAMGALYLSRLWLWLLIGLAFSGWLGLALTATSQLETWLHFGIAMMMSIVLAGTLQRIRLRAYGQMFELAQQRDSQKLQLLQNQISLEERVERRTEQLATLNSELESEVERRTQVEQQLKRNQQSLQRDRNNLEKEVSKRTVELRNSNAKLKEAMSLRDAFMANMSHELRTPLNSILGNSEILMESLYGKLNERQGEAVGRIESSGRHLLNLINDVLDVSKIGAGKLKLTLAPVNVASLCRSSLNMVRTDATRKQIDLSLILDPSVKMVIVDGRRIKQVIVNLLSNAVKFTPVGGRVGLIVRGRTDIQQVLIMVWDTGIGIDEAHINELFKPFVQVDSGLSREHEGTGLGLALSRQLVDLHSGTIGVKSQVGKGSLFVVTLPWALETRADWQTDPALDGLELELPDPQAPTIIETNVEAMSTLPLDGKPSEIAEWVTQSPDAQSPLEPMGTVD